MGWCDVTLLKQPGWRRYQTPVVCRSCGMAALVSACKLLWRGVVGIASRRQGPCAAMLRTAGALSVCHRVHPGSCRACGLVHAQLSHMCTAAPLSMCWPRFATQQCRLECKRLLRCAATWVPTAIPHCAVPAARHLLRVCAAAAFSTAQSMALPCIAAGVEAAHL